MSKISSCLTAFVLFHATAFAADPGLLSLMMPDAKAIAGVQVAQARTSPFGQYVLTHMQPDDPAFLKFMADTGFDPRRDLTEIVMASGATTDVTSHFLVAAHGSFDPVKITNAAKLNGSTITTFMGIGEIKAGTESVVAFLNSNTALMGDAPSVEASIQRSLHASLPSFASSPFLPQLQKLSAANDFWFLSLVPLSEFSGIMPDPNLGQAMNGNLFQAITQVTGGVKFGANVQLGIQATARSEKDAQALADVMRFIAGLIQTNTSKDKSATASQVATLLDTMKLEAVGNTTNLSLLIPEATLEQMFTSERAQQRAARASRKRVAAPPQ